MSLVDPSRHLGLVVHPFWMWANSHWVQTAQNAYCIGVVPKVIHWLDHCRPAHWSSYSFTEDESAHWGATPYEIVHIPPPEYGSVLWSQASQNASYVTVVLNSMWVRSLWANPLLLSVTMSILYSPGFQVSYRDLQTSQNEHLITIMMITYPPWIWIGSPWFQTSQNGHYVTVILNSTWIRSLWANSL